MTRRTTSDDERKLFEQTFKEGRPIKVATSKAPARKKAGASGPSGVNGATQDRLKRGLIEPDARIDLHGMTQLAAHRTLFTWLASAHKSGHRLVLVVTGKGNPKNDENAPWMISPHGVLKQMVPRWLNEPELAALITAAAQRGGSVVVPAFAIERTQKFLFILKHLMESGQMPRLPVFCDSPMAIKAVQIFLKHTEEYSDDTRNLIRQHGSPLHWPGFTFASTPEESKKINAVASPAVIISSSGMVTGGRIMHHLAQRLPDPRNLILFIGFQAPGTRGFTIKSKASEVKLFGDYVPIRAQVAALEQFSDHADPPELLEWLHTFRNQPGVTYLVHGEPEASGQLRDVMKKDLGWNVQVAQYLEKVEVK